MKGRIVLGLLMLIGAAYGQKLPDAPATKPGWVTLAALGSEILADGVTTRVLYQRGYDETDPMAKRFVHAGVAGQVGGSLLGAAALGGVWWALHGTHHDQMARRFLRSVVAVEGVNVARQFAILRTSKK
jgi:hypothetical protein